MLILKKWTKYLLLLILPLMTLVSLAGTSAHAATAIPDISEWQGKLTDKQVSGLKSQVAFVINRRQYGIGHVDRYASHNTALYTKYGIPFGEYDFATFSSPARAKAEAKTFYQRANPNAQFYVLDYEALHTSRGQSNAAVNAWYNEMHHLTNKKLVFYSYQSFATSYATQARKKFDAQWIANYSKKPTIQTDLWQFSNHKYFPALKKHVDASSILNSKKPLNWWIGGTPNASANN